MNSTEFVNPVWFLPMGVVALIGWLIIRSRAKQTGPRKLFIPQFMFTGGNKVLRLTGEAVAGVMLTEHHGGQPQDPAAVAVHRFGRVWSSPGTRDPGTMRERRQVYVTRQTDGAAINLRGLFDPNVKKHRQYTRDELRPMKHLASRMAMADAVRRPGSRDIMMRRLYALAAISVVIGALGWLIVTIVASLNAPTV